MAFWGLGTYVFFSYVCQTRLALGTRKFFRKILEKKKIDLPENLKFFFFQKVDFWGFPIENFSTQKLKIKKCLGSGLTWHMQKIIFVKKTPFNFEFLDYNLGSILRSSVKEWRVQLF